MKPRSSPLLIFAAVYLAYLLYGLDRTVIAIVVEPIRHELGLSDGQIGLVTGLAYGVPFAVAGVLVGPLIDRRHRPRLMAAMLAIWSAATLACGFVTGFVTLLLARLFVGAAEAGGTPASLAILADCYRADRRATVFGLYKTALPLGMFLSTLICGYAAHRFGWRAAFAVAGIPGLLLALPLASLADPRRGGLDETEVAPAAGPERFTLREVGDFILRRPGIAPLIAGIVIFAFANGGPGVFAVAFLQRAHGLPVSEASFIYGIGIGLGALSPILLGLLGDRLSRRGALPVMHLSIAVCLAALATGLAMALSGSILLCGVALVAWQMLGVGLTAPNYAILLTLTPAGIRGTVMSVVLIGISLIGVGLGPTVVGSLSQAMGSGGEGLRSALVIMLLINLPAAACFALCARRMGPSASPAPQPLPSTQLEATR
jgi:MFS family permease